MAFSKMKKKKQSSRKKIMKKKVCLFCTDKKAMYDYKDVDHLGRYLSERGKMVPRKISGNCAKHQRALARVIKRSRHAGLLPFVMGM